MNKYQETLNNLVKVSCPTGKCCRECDIEKICNCEAKSYIDVLQELVDKATPKKPIGKYTNYRCPVCNRRVRSGKGSSSFVRDNVCQGCFQVLDWSDGDE